MATFTISENFGTYQGNVNYIIDGNESNCWRCDAQQGAGKYVMLTASEPIHVKTVGYITTQTSEVFSGGAWLQVSTDGSSWTDVGQFTGNASLSFDVEKDCQYIRIYCKSGNRYVSISELSINYDAISSNVYTVTIQTDDGVTINKPAENSVNERDDFSVEIHGLINTITDNGVDVVGKLQKQVPQSGGTKTSYVTSYTTSGSISGTRYKNCVGKPSSTTATGNDYASGNSNAKATITYSFDFSEIPQNATITSVSVKVGGHAENTSRSTCTLQLYSGSATKGSQSKFTSTSKQVINMTAGNWTRNELQNARLVFTIGYYGGLVNGVDFVVEYSIPSDGEYYIYTISSVRENHEILVNIGGSTGTPLRVKVGGSWVKVLKIYRKQNGQYIEIDASSLDNSVKYVLRN